MAFKTYTYNVSYYVNIENIELLAFEGFVDSKVYNNLMLIKPFFFSIICTAIV